MLEPEKWGRTFRHGFVKALMARRKDALCSLYRLMGDSASATIIGEREPVYFDCVEIRGNTATLRDPSNKKTTLIYSPFLDNRMILKSLHVIGPVSTSEPAFIF
tara:strand:- start:510 stop:821 length:312 start_codon:yes stop_codon:yes gene_type:complete